MSLRYIAFAAGEPSGDGSRFSGPLAAALDRMGLQRQLHTGSLALFVSKQTPAIVVTGLGVVIGNIFSRSRRPLLDEAALLSAVGGSLTEERLLQDCWGEYIAILLATQPRPACRVLREPSGGVPCIYSCAPGNFFVTSDVSIAGRLGLHKGEIDWAFVRRALQYPHFKAEHTALSGIRELLPGCSLAIQDSELSVQEHWSPWHFVASGRRYRDPAAAASDLRDTVSSVIAAWASVDDHILLELSGGLDSSILGSCLRHARENVTCHTLVTPVPGADERHYAKLIASALGVELHSTTLGFADARVDLVPAASTATPRIGLLQHAIYCVMVAAGDKHGCSCFYSGGGGDSVFAYLSTAAPAVDAYRENGLLSGIAAVRNLSELHQCTFWRASRLALRKLLREPTVVSTGDTSFLPPDTEIEAPHPHPWMIAPVGAYPGDGERIFELVATQVFREGTPRGDSRYIRMPLLSQPILEACLRVPTWMWISEGRNRAVARDAFSDRLPLEILNRRSKGTFNAYLGAIFDKNKAHMLEFLLSGHLRDRNLIDALALEQFFARDLPPRDRSFLRILDLCMFEIWLRHRH